MRSGFETGLIVVFTGALGAGFATVFEKGFGTVFAGGGGGGGRVGEGGLATGC